MSYTQKNITGGIKTIEGENMTTKMKAGLVFGLCVILAGLSAWYTAQDSPFWVSLLIVSSIVGTVAGVKAGIIKIKELKGLLG